MFVPQLSLVLIAPSYPWRDGQAVVNLIGCLHTKMVYHLQMATHPSTKQTQHRATTLVETNCH